MTRFAFPYAFLLLALPFVWRLLMPAVKGLHGDALKIPFLSDLEKISIKSGALWRMGSATAAGGFNRFFWFLYMVWAMLTIAGILCWFWIFQPQCWRRILPITTGESTVSAR